MTSDDDAHRREDQDVDLRVREEPEQVLPEERVAAAGHVHDLAADDETARQEEAGSGEAIHQLQHAGRFERREGEQQQERGHELRPDEERQPHPAQALGAQLDDRDDEVHRAEQRRGDQEDHPDQPPGLAAELDDRQRRIGRPAGARGALRHEEARQHHDAADEVHPVAHHVELGERHVGRADLQRHHEVAEPADRERHDAEEDHDRAVHRPELVVELGQHDAAGRVGRRRTARR